MVRHLQHELDLRDKQVASLNTEVQRLTALLPRDVRKSHRKPTRREKIMGLQ